MSQQGTLLMTILLGNSNINITFHLLCELPKSLGSEEQVRRSHHIIKKWIEMAKEMERSIPEIQASLKTL